MKSYAERLTEIGERQKAIDAALPSLREARDNALADEDHGKAERLRVESERLVREYEDLVSKSEVLARRQQEAERAEATRIRQAALGRLGELNKVRVKVGRKIDLAWQAMEEALQELDSVEQRVRAIAFEAGEGADVSKRLGVHARMLHRGAALALAPQMAVLLGIDRLPVSTRRPLATAFTSVAGSSVAAQEAAA